MEVISSKGCSRLLAEISPSISSFRGHGFQSYPMEPSSPASTASATSELTTRDNRPRGSFSGLVICVTGLSKGIPNFGFIYFYLSIEMLFVSYR